MMPSAWPRAVITCCSFGVISWDISAVEMSVAISRSSMPLTVTVCPCFAIKAAAPGDAVGARRMAHLTRALAQHEPLVGETDLDSLTYRAARINRYSFLMMP